MRCNCSQAGTCTSPDRQQHRFCGVSQRFTPRRSSSEPPLTVSDQRRGRYKVESPANGVARYWEILAVSAGLWEMAVDTLQMRFKCSQAGTCTAPDRQQHRFCGVSQRFTPRRSSSEPRLTVSDQRRERYKAESPANGVVRYWEILAVSAGLWEMAVDTLQMRCNCSQAGTCTSPNRQQHRFCGVSQRFAPRRSSSEPRLTVSDQRRERYKAESPANGVVRYWEILAVSAELWEMAVDTLQMRCNCSQAGTCTSPNRQQRRFCGVSQRFTPRRSSSEPRLTVSDQRRERYKVESPANGVARYWEILAVSAGLWEMAVDTLQMRCNCSQAGTCTSPDRQQRRFCGVSQRFTPRRSSSEPPLTVSERGRGSRQT